MATVTGTQGPDNLAGGPTADFILGLPGNDTLAGDGGNDSIAGGTGNDQIAFGVEPNGAFDQPGANGSSRVYGGEGEDVIVSEGGFGNNTVIGGTGNAAIDAVQDKGDSINLFADQGRDIVTGNYGDDTIGIGQGGASAFGGMGNDVVLDRTSSYFTDQITGDPFPPGNGMVDVTEAGTGAASANDVIFGGEGDDVIDVTPIGDASIVGGTGNPAIDVSADGADTILIESNGGDTTIGASNDVILGNYGDDVIDATGDNSGPNADQTFNQFYGAYDGQARGGSDTLVGGMGNDQIYSGEQSNDIILGNQGNDFVVDLEAQAGTDTIYGGVGDDTIVAGNPTQGNPGFDTFDDSYGGAAATGVNDLIYGGEGNDYIETYGNGSDTLYGGVDSTGGSADGANAFDVSGQTGGNDFVYGGPSTDYFLVGYTDAHETMTGGAGVDTFSFFGGNSDQTATSGAYDGSGLDVINDFVSGSDKIDDPQKVAYTDSVGVIAGTGTLDEKASTAIVDARNNRGTADTSTGVNAVVFQTRAGGDFYLAVDNNGTGGYDAGNDLLIDIKTTSSVAAGDFLNAGANPSFPGPS